MFFVSGSEIVKQRPMEQSQQYIFQRDVRKKFREIVPLSNVYMIASSLLPAIPEDASLKSAGCEENM